MHFRILKIRIPLTTAFIPQQAQRKWGGGGQGSAAQSILLHKGLGTLESPPPFCLVSRIKLPGSSCYMRPKQRTVLCR